MPNNPTERHYLVEFAARHARTNLKTFNAGSALRRAEDLAYDIEELATLATEVEKKEIRFGSVFSSYEIISYYAVALVTCLEWHARSRLVDLLLFKPRSIRISDVKGIADLAISQMVEDGITVPHLLGAATHISSIREYVAVFERLFEEMETKLEFEQQFRGLKTAKEAASMYDTLDALFLIRNDLVHEISFGMIGHRNIRNVWSLEEAGSFARNVIATIKFVELLITKHSSTNFPNRLTEEGFEENEFEKLLKAIAYLEDEISAALNIDEPALAKWRLSLETQKEILRLNFDFIESTVAFVPIRYFDVRETMKAELLKSRLTFLLAVKSEVV